MAWLTAPVLAVNGSGNQPVGGSVIIPVAGVLAQGALDQRNWISPLDTNLIIVPTVVSSPI